MVSKKLLILLTARNFIILIFLPNKSFCGSHFRSLMLLPRFGGTGPSCFHKTLCGRLLRTLVIIRVSGASGKNLIMDPRENTMKPWSPDLLTNSSRSCVFRKFREDNYAFLLTLICSQDRVECEEEESVSFASNKIFQLFQLVFLQAMSEVFLESSMSKFAKNQKFI